LRQTTTWGKGPKGGSGRRSRDLLDGQQLAKEERHQRASICGRDLEGGLDLEGDQDRGCQEVPAEDDGDQGRASTYPNDRE
jgi:hypothetical protein